MSLEELKQNISKYKKKRNKESFDPRLKNDSTGLRIASDLIANIIVGCFLGYYLDKFFETSPICLVVGLLLGSFIAFYNIYNFFKQDN